MGLEILDVMFRGICVGVAASITVGPVAVLCIIFKQGVRPGDAVAFRIVGERS